MGKATARGNVEFFEIEVKNWEKFNPRKRVHSSWFRMNHDVFDDPDMHDFTAPMHCLWVLILSLCSRHNAPIVRLYPAHVMAKIKVKMPIVLTAIKKLERNQMISLLACSTDVARKCSTNVTNVTNVTNETIRTFTTRPKAAQPPKHVTGPTPVGQVRDAFLESYEKEFGHEYAGWGAKENGQTANWLKSVSLDKAISLCRIYPAWNDPKVTQLGHPFGPLITDYVRLDAWSRSPERRISKLAQGRAAERVDIKRATEREESKRGLQYRLQQDAEDLRDSRESERTVSHVAAKEVPRIGSDSSLAEVFNPRGKAHASTSG